jgi:hypothetical protein
MCALVFGGSTGLRLAVFYFAASRVGQESPSFFVKIGFVGRPESFGEKDFNREGR